MWSVALVGEPPTASPFGHPFVVGVNWDPRMYHVQRDVMTERQLVPVRLFAVFVVVVVVEWSCRVHFCSSAHNIRRGGFLAFLANVQICSGPESRLLQSGRISSASLSVHSVSDMACLTWSLDPWLFAVP